MSFIVAAEVATPMLTVAGIEPEATTSDLAATSATQSFGDDLGLRQIGFRQQQREFFAADPRQHIALALAVARQIGQMHDHLVADLVAETVIDRFEIVDVDHQERDRPPIAAGPRPFVIRQRQKVPAIIDAGHAVGGRQPLQVLRMAHDVGDVAVDQHAAAAGQHGQMAAQRRAVGHRQIHRIRIAGLHPRQPARHVVVEIDGDRLGGGRQHLGVERPVFRISSALLALNITCSTGLL